MFGKRAGVGQSASPKPMPSPAAQPVQWNYADWGERVPGSLIDTLFTMLFRGLNV